MGVDPPFLYDKPSKYTFQGPNDRTFNPKGVTQASWTPKPTRPKPTGPLINEINKHPDSYLIVPYGNLTWKPMSPRTKTKVKWLRLIQLFLRICALLGAAGLLVCVICIRPTGSTLDWIIRVPPGIAILHTVYAVYHLSRASKTRTPASSASYAIFASIIDAGILPFLAFTAWMSRNQHIMGGNEDAQWETLFGIEQQTYKIIWATYLLSVTNGGLHLASLILSLYLAFLFRKISKLPPDMNPLEDNLTSRHKRNKSSLSVAATGTPSNRDSQVSAPLMESPRLVPFMHTRNDSAASLSTNPQRRNATSKRNSRSDLGMYSQPTSQRSSYADLRQSPQRQSPNRKSYAESKTSFTPSGYEPVDLDENWTSYPSPTGSPDHPSNNGSLYPPELQHLRDNGSGTSTPRHDYSSCSPRPLEMNPPTPPTNSAVRNSPRRNILQPTSANSSPATWEEKNWERNVVPVESLVATRGKTRFYGDLKSSLGRKQQRVVSSGVDVDRVDEKGNGNMRARDVSGKVVEEGRGGVYGYRYE